MQSLELREVVYANVIGPLPIVGGAKYIGCIEDSATRIAKVYKTRTTTSTRSVKSFEAWIKL